MFIELAQAMAPSGGQAAGGASTISALLPLVLIFFVFYFLLIRPQQKQARQRQEMLNTIKKGDEIITSGGLHGKVTGVTDQVLTIEVADNVRVKISRSYIAGLQKDLMKKPEDKEKTKEKEKEREKIGP